MIYDIDINDTKRSRSVRLTMSLTDFDDNHWAICTITDKKTGETHVSEWHHYTFDGGCPMEDNDVPLWCKRLFAHLQPRIMELLKSPEIKSYKSYVESLGNAACEGI